MKTNYYFILLLKLWYEYDEHDESILMFQHLLLSLNCLYPFRTFLDWGAFIFFFSHKSQVMANLVHLVTSTIESIRRISILFVVLTVHLKWLHSQVPRKKLPVLSRNLTQQWWVYNIIDAIKLSRANCAPEEKRNYALPKNFEFNCFRFMC